MVVRYPCLYRSFGGHRRDHRGCDSWVARHRAARAIDLARAWRRYRAAPGRTWTVLIVAQVALTVAALPVAAAMGWDSVSTDAKWPAFAANEFLAVRFSTDFEPPPDVDPAAYQRDRAARAVKYAAKSPVALNANRGWRTSRWRQRHRTRSSGAPLKSKGCRVDRECYARAPTASRRIPSTRSTCPSSPAAIDGRRHDHEQRRRRPRVRSACAQGRQRAGRRVRYIEPDTPNRAQSAPPRWYESWASSPTFRSDPSLPNTTSQPFFTRWPPTMDR